MKIIFLGSPAFAVPSLEALHQSDHSIVAVVTQPDRPTGRGLLAQPPAVKTSAVSLGIPVLQPVTTKSPEFVDQIKVFESDLLVVVAYGEILRPSLLSAAPGGAINLHASLLPHYRGAAPVAWTILRGETETGVTTMQMDEGMDSGPILLQATTSILPTDTTSTLGQRLAVLGAGLLKETLDRVEKGEVLPRPQDSSQATFAPKLKKQDGWIHWDKDAFYVARQIRAFDPWPGSFTRMGGNTLKLWIAHPASELTQQPAGTVIRVAREAFWVACGEGTVLQVIEVQPENRPRLTAADFLHGYRVAVGDVFSSDIA
jgi:methionyl-tRNA formyltransferase